MAEKLCKLKNVLLPVQLKVRHCGQHPITKFVSTPCIRGTKPSRQDKSMDKKLDN
jgi:hypothetical protein